MWGRIATIATKLDNSFGTEDSNRGSQRSNDGDDEGEEEAEEGSFSGEDARVTDAAPAGGGGKGREQGEVEDDSMNEMYEDDDPDGWGDDIDGLDDELDFGDDDDDDDDNEGPLLENGVNGSFPQGEQSEMTEKEGSRHEDDLKVDAGEGLVAKMEDINISLGESSERGATPDATADAEKNHPDVDADNVPKKEGQEMEEEEAQQPLADAPLQSQPQSPPENDSSQLPNEVTVSAPGKALVAGGYLVLESPNPGVVLAVEGCRFHATVAFRPPYSEGGRVVVGNSVDASWESTPLDVYSPQFDRVFSYYLSYSPTSCGDGNDVCLRLQPRTGPHEPNQFVERSLLLVLGYLRRSMGGEAFQARLQQQQSGAIAGGGRVALAVKLRADNDFYSQVPRLRERGLDLTLHNLEKLEPFLPCPKNESTGKLIVNKTGMGSSAALVTSLVGALLRFFGVICLPTSPDENNPVPKLNGDGGAAKEGLRIAHNLSQICHCHAQGKVGSGFDVSSAVYGSQVYTRFSKEVISNFLESTTSVTNGDKGALQLSEELSGQLVELVIDAEWDCTVSTISLPPGLELMMADVCGGSKSPSMARSILEWKKNRRKVGFMDDYYWKDLKRCNKKVVSLLSDQFTSQTFLDGLRRDGAVIISNRTAEQWKKPMPSSWHEFEGSSWDVALKLFDLRMAFLECRQNLKGMGKAAGVPVEPDEQTALADATMKLPGVIAAGVPGAGGYDALYVIYVKGPETDHGMSDRVRDEIGKLWREMSEKNSDAVVCPLSVRAAASDRGLCITELDW